MKQLIVIVSVAAAGSCREAGAQITAFSLKSSPTSWVGHGQNQVYTEAAGFTFLGLHDFGSTAEVWVMGDVYGSWIMQFSSPGGGAMPGQNFPAPGMPPLTLGDYPNATRYPFHDLLAPGSAGLSFYGQGRGPNTLTGSFVILEFVPGVGRDLVSFAANFIQYDEEARDAWNEGRIRFNSSVPLSVPESAGVVTALTALAGFLIIASFSRERIACR
jgi:hypothetical protein